MGAPALAATPERGVSMAPVGDTGQPDRLATVRMPTAAAMAVRLGLPGVSGRPPASSRTGALKTLTDSASVPAAVEPVEGAPRIDIVLHDDGAGDVQVDGRPVATGIDVAETYTAIVALVLDTAGKAGRPAQVSVASGDGIRRTLVAPDGSVRRLGAGARHASDRPTAVATDAPATPPSSPGMLPGSWPDFQLREPMLSQLDAPPTAGAPQSVAHPQPAGQPVSGTVVQPQAAPVALAPVPVDPPAEPMLPAVPMPPAGPTVRPEPTAPSHGAGGADLPFTGPAHPQTVVRPPEDELPARSCPPAPLVVVGAHGGAGESSLAALVPGWCAAGHAWPAPRGVRQPVILVARTSLVGLTAARTALTQWSSGQVPHVEVVGLVLVADAPGRLPRSLRDLVKAVSGGAPRVWSVPWVKGWRTGRPQLSEVPKKVQQLVHQLDALTRSVPSSLGDG